MFFKNNNNIYSDKIFYPFSNKKVRLEIAGLFQYIVMKKSEEFETLLNVFKFLFVVQTVINVLKQFEGVSIFGVNLICFFEINSCFFK